MAVIAGESIVYDIQMFFSYEMSTYPRAKQFVRHHVMRKVGAGNWFTFMWLSLTDNSPTWHSPSRVILSPADEFLR